MVQWNIRSTLLFISFTEFEGLKKLSMFLLCHSTLEDFTFKGFHGSFSSLTSSRSSWCLWTQNVERSFRRDNHLRTPSRPSWTESPLLRWVSVTETKASSPRGDKRDLQRVSARLWVQRVYPLTWKPFNFDLFQHIENFLQMLILRNEKCTRISGKRQLIYYNWCIIGGLSKFYRVCR